MNSGLCAWHVWLPCQRCSRMSRHWHSRRRRWRIVVDSQDAASVENFVGTQLCMSRNIIDASPCRGTTSTDYATDLSSILNMNWKVNEQSPCLSGSASGSTPLSTLGVTTVTSWLTSKACRRARHWARHVMVARNLIRRSRRRAHHGQLVIAFWRCCVIVPYIHCRTRHVVDVVVRDAIVMLTWDSLRHHDIMNSFLELWYYKSIRSSWIEIRNSKLIFFSTIDDFKSAFKLLLSNPGRKLQPILVFS
jgi:hypothetical protein